MNLNLMLDLETVSTENDAGIISIALVPFAFPETIPHFYQKPTVVGQESMGFHLSSSTMDWWQKQATAAKNEAFSGTQHITEILASLESYFAELPLPTKQVFIWGNGSDFDNVILRNAFDRCGIPVPWEFRNNRCYRTLSAMFPVVERRPFPGAGVKHTALYDAQIQALHAEDIFGYIERMELK